MEPWEDLKGVQRLGVGVQSSQERWGKQQGGSSREDGMAGTEGVRHKQKHEPV